jgi:DNA-binding Lrp family transcriptional regulator
MPKNAKENVMKDEIRVLTILEQHAEDSIDEIAKRCGFSRQKVWRIVKHLEEKKIIWGYTAVTDETAKNLKHFIVLIKKTNSPLNDAARKEIMFDKLDNYPEGLIEIENIYYTHGVCDLILTFYSSDLISAKKFLEFTYERYSKYIQEFTLIETLFPIRKQRIKNPQIKNLIDYL